MMLCNSLCYTDPGSHSHTTPCSPLLYSSCVHYITWINSFPPQISTFSQQLIFYPLFLNEDGRILKNGLSKLHYWFRQYSTLTKTVLLESQYLQIYDGLSDFLRPKFEEDRHNFADIEIQAKSIMQLTKTFFPKSAIFIERKWLENRLWAKSAFLSGKKCIIGR